MLTSMNDIPAFDDIANKESYKIYKWMAHRKIFSISDFYKKFGSIATENGGCTTILSGMALADLLYIKHPDDSYYSNDELSSISFEELSCATIEAAPRLSRYIEKREDEKLHWFLPTVLSIISLCISVLTLIASVSSTTVNVKITSWPATAETAQQPEIIYQYQPSQ